MSKLQFKEQGCFQKTALFVCFNTLTSLNKPSQPKFINIQKHVKCNTILTKIIEGNIIDIIPGGVK